MKATKNLLVDKKQLYFIVFLGWMVFVTYLSLASFDDLDTGVSFFKIPHLDKYIHFTFYFVATILGTLYIKEKKNANTTLNKTIMFAACFAISYGIFIEIVQRYGGFERDGDILDALANTVGAVIGSLAIKRVLSKKNAVKRKN